LNLPSIVLAYSTIKNNNNERCHNHNIIKMRRIGNIVEQPAIACIMHRKRNAVMRERWAVTVGAAGKCRWGVGVDGVIVVGVVGRGQGHGLVRGVGGSRLLENHPIPVRDPLSHPCLSTQRVSQYPRKCAWQYLQHRLWDGRLGIQQSKTSQE
jgi:hypothetical protein